MSSPPSSARSRPEVRPAFHALPAAEVTASVASGADGLSADEATRRRDEVGRNELAQAPAPSQFRLFLSQFASAVVWLLVIAAIVSGALGEWIDTAAILAIVVLNGALGFLQEDKSRRRWRPWRSWPRRRLTCCAGAPGSRSTPATSCPATACGWKPATTCRPTPGWSRPPASACRSRRSPANRCRSKRTPPPWSPKRPRWAIAATWSTWARSPPPARPRPSSWPRACRPRWDTSPACSSARRPNPPRSNDAWTNWAAS